MSHRNFCNWVQCSKRNPCPQCSGDHDCTLTTDGLMSKCMRTAGVNAVKQKDGRTASIRRVSECGEAGQLVKRSKPQPSAPRMKTREVELLIRQHRTALSPGKLAATSKELGVSADALEDVGIGFDADSGCVSFPMYNGSLKPVGMRLRRSNPRPGQQRYLCIRGSQNGLFIPKSYNPTPIDILDDPARSVLVLPEGPTDVAAALDLGQHAVGRFSNSGGQAELATLITSAPAPVELVIVADRDDAKHMPDGSPYFPGWEGALSIAISLYRHKNIARLKVAFPPDSAKDLREWVKGGGTAQAFICYLDAIPVATSDWLSHKRHAMERIKELTVRNVKTKRAKDPADALRMAREELVRRAAG